MKTKDLIHAFESSRPKPEQVNAVQFTKENLIPLLEARLANKQLDRLIGQALKNESPNLEPFQQYLADRGKRIDQTEADYLTSAIIGINPCCLAIAMKLGPVYNISYSDLLKPKESLFTSDEKLESPPALPAEAINPVFFDPISEESIHPLAKAGKEADLEIQKAMSDFEIIEHEDIATYKLVKGPNALANDLFSDLTLRQDLLLEIGALPDLWEACCEKLTTETLRTFIANAKIDPTATITIPNAQDTDAYFNHQALQFILFCTLQVYKREKLSDDSYLGSAVSLAGSISISFYSLFSTPTSRTYSIAEKSHTVNCLQKFLKEQSIYTLRAELDKGERGCFVGPAARALQEDPDLKVIVDYAISTINKMRQIPSRHSNPYLNFGSSSQ